MLSPRERRNRRKLLVSAVTLAAVIVVAAVAQRKHAIADPFPATEFTRSRTDEQANRPVFGAGTSRPESDNPLPRETPVQPAETPALQTQDGRDTRIPADVLGTVERWRSSLAKGDVTAHVATYAPRVERFLRQRRVSRDVVQRERNRMLDRYPQINKYEIHDFRLESIKGDRVVLTFRKDWDTSGGGSRRFAGSERQRLTLRRTGSEWKIVGEEEVKVHWVRRS
jgi:hypothetical protein